MDWWEGKFTIQGLPQQPSLRLGNLVVHGLVFVGADVCAESVATVEDVRGVVHDGARVSIGIELQGNACAGTGIENAKSTVDGGGIRSETKITRAVIGVEGGINKTWRCVDVPTVVGFPALNDAIPNIRQKYITEQCSIT